MNLIRLIMTMGVAVGMPAAALAHGNVPIQEDPCTRSVRASTVHYSTYQERDGKMEQFCQEVPHAGPALLVVDIVDKDLREQALGVRVEARDAQGMTKTLLEVPAQAYPHGVIEMETRLDQPGRYAVSLFVPGDPDKLGQFEMMVETANYNKLIQQIVTYAVVALFALWLGIKVKNKYVARRNRGRGDAAAKP